LQAEGRRFDPGPLHFLGHCANRRCDEPVHRQDLGAAVDAQLVDEQTLPKAPSKTPPEPPRERRPWRLAAASKRAPCQLRVTCAQLVRRTLVGSR
jgi:hypothetical protein